MRKLGVDRCAGAASDGRTLAMRVWRGALVAVALFYAVVEGGRAGARIVSVSRCGKDRGNRRGGWERDELLSDRSLRRRWLPNHRRLYRRVVQEFSQSRNGARIAFSSSHWGDIENDYQSSNLPSQRIFLMNADGTGVRQLGYHNPNAASEVISPSRRRQKAPACSRNHSGGLSESPERKQT